MVTRDGRLKILDFGLALEQPPGATGGDTESPTLARETDPGTVVGTVGYMSPEQVRGDAVDHRSDIFSLGCVLHEMLSGRRAFARETVAETMTAILREDASPLAGPGRAVPPALERIVSHCLEKKPEQRFQSASDLAFDLANLSGSSGAGAGASAIPRRRAAWRWLAGGLAALLLLGAGYRAGRRAAVPEARQPRTRALHADHRPARSGVQAQPLTRRQDGRVCEPGGRRRRRLRAARGRPQPDQPHAGLRERRHRAGVCSRRRADRIPLRVRRRGRLRDGRDRRVASQGRRRRPRPGVVSRRRKPRRRQRAVNQPVGAPDSERDFGRGPGERSEPSPARAGRAAAHLVAGRASHRVLGLARRHGRQWLEGHLDGRGRRRRAGRGDK